jgi:hypothetical protein
VKNHKKKKQALNNIEQKKISFALILLLIVFLDFSVILVLSYKIKQNKKKRNNMKLNHII